MIEFANPDDGCSLRARRLPRHLLSPGFRCQAIEFLHILRIEIGTASLSYGGKKLFGTTPNRSHGRLMPVEPFLHQSQETASAGNVSPRAAWFSTITWMMA